MANSVTNQPRKIALWQDRPVVVLIGGDLDDEACYHGVMAGPAGMSYEEALARLDAAYLGAVETAGEGWNYDDVLDAMKTAGFEEVLAALWGESSV